MSFSSGTSRVNNLYKKDYTTYAREGDAGVSDVSSELENDLE